jgi:Leucine-rich repeat (LRR) protein
LKALYLSNNGMMQTFTPSFPLPTNLEFLYLDSCALTELDCTLLPTGLKYLFIRFNSISNLDTLSHLTNLILLYMNTNNLQSFNPIGLTTLRSIDVSGNDITTQAWNDDIDWIANAPNYGQFYAYGNTDSIIGTQTETLLLAKNWYILK